MAKLHKAEDGSLIFDCPACGTPHVVNVDPDRTPCWEWNRSMTDPTFQPSVLSRTNPLTEAGNADYKKWLEDGCPPRTTDLETSQVICHSFVSFGRISYLGDCTHSMAGQTVELPEIEP